MALGRKSLLGLALAAAATVPYAVTSATSSKPSQAARLGQPRPPRPAAAAAAANPQQAARAEPRLEGPQVRSLDEVFRFNATPHWITANWSRVLTQSDQAGSRSYRVPLVTGSRPQDLAGALTYRFGQDQQVEQIHFRGTTGDPLALETLVTRRFGLVRKRTSDPGLYLYQAKSGGKVTSEMVVRTSPLLTAGNPHSRYSLELLLSRPSDFRALTQDTRPLDNHRLVP